jgi:hypothetical protein
MSVRRVGREERRRAKRILFFSKSFREPGSVPIIPAEHQNTTVRR